MLALYVVTLSLSAALAGLFTRQILGDFGLAQEFQDEALLACGAALAYAALQLFYFAFLRAFKPTRSGAPLVAESLSLLAAVLLAPYLLGVSVVRYCELLNIPLEQHYGLIAKVEPLIYAGAFGAAHGFFKLMSFFAAIKGEPSSRLGAMGWLAMSLAAAMAALTCGESWLNTSGEMGEDSIGELAEHESGGAYALSRALQEGAQFEVPVSAIEDACLTFYWANPSPSSAETAVSAETAADGTPVPAEESGLEQIHVNITLEGTQKVEWSEAIDLDPSGWATLHLSGEQIPAGLETCRVFWTAEKEPSWRRVTGLRPMVRSFRTMLMAGPYVHQLRTAETPPNTVVVMVEGLGAAHVSGLGYGRETTPSLDKHGASGLALAYTYTPVPEAMGASLSALTGLNPLVHHYLDGQKGPLPDQCTMVQELLKDAHYATAAFTEGKGPGAADLVFGSGLERGFELFDAASAADGAAPEGAEGSKRTLDKVKAWVTAHDGLSFFAFVRIRELADPGWRDRYAPGFAGDKDRLAAIDVYDSALAYLDGELGGLIRHVRAAPNGKQTCIIVTSPYGLDFSAGAQALPVVGLTEESLRVPMLATGPGFKRDERKTVVSLMDIAPTVAEAAGLGFDYAIEGRNLVDYLGWREPVSLFGTPLALSLRAEKWRFTWQSGRYPFSERASAEEMVIELVDVGHVRRSDARLDRQREHPELLVEYRNQLAGYLDEYWPGTR